MHYLYYNKRSNKQEYFIANIKNLCSINASTQTIHISAYVHKVKIHDVIKDS